MISCPGCGFLMGDTERQCSSCAAAATAGPGDGQVRFDLDDPAGPSTSGAIAAASTGTAVLERRPPTAAPMPEHLEYRQRRSGRRGRLAVALVALGALVAGVVVGLDGRGPFAEPLVSAGLIAPPAVRIPSSWVEVSPDGGGFVAALPQGAKPLGEDLVGYTVPVGERAALTVFSTDFDLGPSGMAAYGSAGGLDELIDRFTAVVGVGEEIVRREVRAAEGWASDAVYVSDDGVTTRARFHLARGRFHGVVTAGPDEAMDQLDAVHPQLLSEFRLE